MKPGKADRTTTAVTGSSSLATPSPEVLRGNPTGPASPPLEIVPIESLHPHPKNYRKHPPDQIAHIVASITEHGVYRNIVIAREGTILAGHGVVLALREMGQPTVAVFRLPIDPDSPAALKVVAGDNEIGHLAEVDDRLFLEMMKEIQSADSLLGTGFDDAMLANLAFVTFGQQNTEDTEAAWAAAGMPGDLNNGVQRYRLILGFPTEQARADWVAATPSITVMHRMGIAWTGRETKDAEPHDFATVAFVDPAKVEIPAPEPNGSAAA